MKSKTKSQQGYALLFSLFIIATVLAGTLAVTRIFTPRIRAITESINSTMSIFAADTASEVCLYEARNQPASPVARPILTNGGTFTIASLSATPVTITNDCRPLGGGNFRFRTVGTFRDVSRALEVNQ